MDLNIPEGILRAGIRTQLNLMMHLCGIATKTAELVKELKGTRCKLLDTRKTLPGLRAFEKYAHRIGGGVNHRFGRDCGIIIKKEDVAAAGSVRKAIVHAKGGSPYLLAFEVEVEDPSQLASMAVDSDVTHVLLDNMEPADVRGCVQVYGERFFMEASGIAPERLREYAQTGVPFISTSATIMGAKPTKLHLVMR
jgi:nicotinate-nucleotide pyrophosphorylase (carboxylating)